MSEEIEVRMAYCQTCEENFTLGYSESDDTMYVVCDCGVSEEVDDFLDRFMESRDGEDETIRGYQ